MPWKEEIVWQTSKYSPDGLKAIKQVFDMYYFSNQIVQTVNIYIQIMWRKLNFHLSKYIWK
jgi:hypothetical protein